MSSKCTVFTLGGVPEVVRVEVYLGQRKVKMSLCVQVLVEDAIQDRRHQSIGVDWVKGVLLNEVM